MDQLKEDILNCLKTLKGTGKFISKGTAAFQFPGLEVDGLGEISYPVNEIQAKALIDVAKKAPFGKGSETVFDDTVRSAWEVDAAKLTFNGKGWDSFLNKTLTAIKQDLGLEDYTVSAHLYKLLIYKKGDFFLPHKDSEKEEGMFGTLIIGLPSRYTGGELLVNFDGVTETVDFAHVSSDYKINYAAFYADCDHEVKPLTSGYRVCLVYNLVQQKGGGTIELPSLGTYVEKLANLFTEQRQKGNTQPHIILLGHQYTPANFSADRLKLNDRPKAEALLQAAKKAGCYAKLCLVTSYLSGIPEDDGRYYDYHYDEEEADDEDAEMAEVYDESLYIENWIKDDTPALSHVGFEEEDLITSFALNEGDPVVKESTGYMGNYGPDLMHWYHYGAVMIWSPEVNAQLLPQQDTTSKLDWIDYFNQNAQQSSDSEIAAVELILSTGLEKTRYDKEANYNAIADWVIHRKNEKFFSMLSLPVCQLYFTKIDTAHWLKLIDFLPWKVSEQIFFKVTQDINISVVEQLLTILDTLSATGLYDNLVSDELKKLPDHLAALTSNPSKKQFPITRNALSDLFEIEKRIPQREIWINRMTEVLTKHSERGHVTGILVPELLTLKGETKLASNLLLFCRQYLQERVDNQPQPPADWSRQVPSGTGEDTRWQLLKAFLESPDQQVFDYRKNQAERTELENAIRHVTIDLRTETIRKGSPHTLRIIKTQAAYEEAMKTWGEDRTLLNKIIDRQKRITGF